MTRYTSLGHKRTHVAAEFNYRDTVPKPDSSISLPLLSGSQRDNESGPTVGIDAVHLKNRKRKKTNEGARREEIARYQYGSESESGAHEQRGGFGGSGPEEENGKKKAPAQSEKAKGAKE